METQKDVLLLEDVVALSGYKRNYLYKLIHLGRIPCYRPQGLKGRLFFKRREVEAFIFQNRLGPSFEGAQK